ncbi:uncharacterized protein METZ01_LOCUS378707, partial [marine metagenome]
VWENIALVAVQVTAPVFSTLTTEISTASFAFVEIIFNASVINAVNGVAVFTLYENEASKPFPTPIANGSENSATNYDR